MEGFTTNYLDITNEDVVVNYAPPSLVNSYSYKIIKNNDVIYESEILYSPVDIKLTDTGTYKIEVVNNYYNNSETITSPEYKIDKEAPIINVSENVYKIKSGDKLNIDITASDIVDGDLTSNIMSNIESLDFKSEGVKKITYSVSDKAGNTTNETIYVTVSSNNTNLIRVGQVSLVVILVLIIVFLNKYIRSIKLEKRFSKYTINSSKNKSISLFDNLYNEYMGFINNMSKILSKSVFLSKRAKRYEKYVQAFKQDSTMELMAKKIVVGVLFILLGALVKLLGSENISSLEILLSFIVGFYTLDIIYYYRYIKYRKKIEKDLFEAISVMNNAFKAGMSITQAVELVSHELNGPIAKEFERVRIEISLGLDIEVAFKRFAKRVNTKEAVYLSSSLSVLNKTGGNIIKVFNSIEKNLFARRKLEQELKALTSSSKLIMYVLIIVPPLFIVFISMLNKDYFRPLFTNAFGIILLIIMVLIYITYIVVVRKVLKVRGIK